jgi:hypothetical protein
MQAQILFEESVPRIANSVGASSEVVDVVTEKEARSYKSERMQRIGNYLQ